MREAVVAAFRLRVVLGFACAVTAAASSVSVFLRVRRGFGAGSASALPVPSSSPATSARGVRRGRAGFVRFGSSMGAVRIGGGASTAGGGVLTRLAIARDGSGGAVDPVGCAAPSAETSKM